MIFQKPDLIPLRLRRERSVERKGGEGVVNSPGKAQPPESPFIKGNLNGIS